MTIQEMIDEGTAEGVTASNAYQGGDETECKKRLSKALFLFAQAMALLVEVS